VEAKGPAYALWRISLRGPALFTDGALSVPAGARLAGYRKGADKPEVEADAGRVTVVLTRKDGALAAERVTGEGGVSIRSRGTRVVARRLVYEAGGGDVDAFGDVRVEAADWPREVRFRHVVFRLTEDGIDLRKASDIEVRPAGKPK
jgi:lipopolysaccharide assembly outer membrane protein LptD (OstA)